MPTMTVEVMGGLCSRLRAVVGAATYCEATGRRLLVNWPHREPSEPLREFPCRLHDLWDVDCDERNQKDGLSKHIEALRSTGDVQLRTCAIEPFLSWMPDIGAVFRGVMKPTVELGAMIGHLADPYAVGVNVRAAQKDPHTVDVQWFIDEVRKRWPATSRTIFAAVDHAASLEALRAAFGDDVMAFARTELGSGPDPQWYRYDRDSVLKQAAELHILADKCGFVLGSNHSSFSQTVAFMRGCGYGGTHERPGGLTNTAAAKYCDAWNIGEGTP